MTSPSPLSPLLSSTNRAQPDFDALSAHFRQALEAACGAPGERFGECVRAALADAAPLVDLLSADVLRGSAERYTRHLLARDDAGRFAAAALVWRPGHITPVHAHHTWCGYRVVMGTLTEELFDWVDEDTCAAVASARERATGSSSFVGAGSEGIHRLANRSSAIAVSLHVYGVHADAIASRVNRVVAPITDIDPPRRAA